MCIENDFGVIWYLVSTISIYYKNTDATKEAGNVMNKEKGKRKVTNTEDKRGTDLNQYIISTTYFSDIVNYLHIT